MARPQIVTMTLVTADADGIAQSQTPGAAGNLTINGALASGGVATLAVPRRVLVTTVSDESGKTLTIYGTDWFGRAITEVMTGPNATTGYTAQDFKTVTRVAVSAAFTGAVTVGTNGIGSSPWLLLNRNAAEFAVGVQVVVSGTVNYTVQTTSDDIMGAYDPSSGIWANAAVPTPFNDSILAAQAANGTTEIDYPCQAVRLLINSGTGTATMTAIQQGIRG